MPSVLVVDDESQIRDLMARWISGDGYQVRQAATAMDALADMQAARSDIVMCDVHMPGENGLWLTGQIRALFPETAVVLATSDRTVPPQISLQPGVVQYLAKPFTREEVLAAVRVAAGWHETAVSEKGRAKVVAPLSKEWAGTSGE
jgi:two-component system phosphate regulon response regulator OmpR